jgi:DnaJ-class molecular chaperone
MASFRSCPVCGGQGHVEITCMRCGGRGSVDTTIATAAAAAVAAYRGGDPAQLAAAMTELEEAGR